MGVSEGRDDGPALGLIDGNFEGACVGRGDGFLVGATDGVIVGARVEGSGGVLTVGEVVGTGTSGETKGDNEGGWESSIGDVNFM